MVQDRAVLSKMGKVKSKKIYKNPNRFFEFWLSNLASEARKKSVKLASTYSKALCSLKKYPIKLSSGKECQLLNGFGTAICNILDERLKDFAERNSLSIPEALALGNSLTPAELAKKCLTSVMIFSNEIPQPPRGKRAQTPEISTLNEDYTHLVTLSNQYPPAQPTRISIAKSSEKASSDIIHDANLLPVDYIPQGAYEIILLVDVRESFNKVKFDETVRARGVKWEISSLPVGDFVWLAREIGGSTTQREIVLGLVVERKRADDLASSIVDGRFVEQKSRMQRLGFRKMYIFEECRNMYNLRISHETLLQAMINSELVDGCDVVTCSNSDQCTAYLTSLTNFLTNESKKCDLAVYSGGRRPQKDPSSVDGLWGIPWLEYVDMGKKSPELPLREQFGLHLLQIHSITGAKAKDIVSLFPTPRR
ncbi:unnamed protein product [Rodentolepis nana]|uniref:Crossover junction endonuclease MUS81 n=1 Tax=Rodentolepis nana TaxID=102285 RepID=A0A3P7T9Z8_RODNA|nr:unnamed protein product [Rodentolepis nana]